MNTDFEVFEPHSGQLDVFKKTEGYKFKVIPIGRRFGKTAMISEIEEPLIDEAFFGKPVLIFTPSAKERSNTFKNIGETYGCLIKRKNSQLQRYDLHGGGNIYFYSLPDKGKKDEGRGEHARVIIYDEFQKIPEEVAEHHLQEVVMPLMLDYPDSEVWFLGTANGYGSFFHKLARRGAVNGNIDSDDLPKAEGDWSQWVTVRGPTSGNPNIDIQAIEEMRKNLPTDIAAQELDAQFIDFSAMNWAYEFKRKQHVSDVDYSLDFRDKVYDLSFDFNRSPGTCLIGQCVPGHGVYVHKVIQVEGGTRALCQAVKLYMNKIGGIYNVTGDFSGNSLKSSAQIKPGGELYSDFAIVKEELELSNGQMTDTRQVNPLWKWSRDITNMVLYNLPVYINQYECEVLVDDLIKGKPKKDSDEVNKNRDTGHGMDALDTFRYFLNLHFGRNGYTDIMEFLHFYQASNPDQ